MFQLGINETPFYKNIFAEIECFKLMLLIVVVAMTQCQFHIFTLMTAETRQWMKNNWAIWCRFYFNYCIIIYDFWLYITLFTLRIGFC